jgi:histidinol-phosphate aminotransferase
MTITEETLATPTFDASTIVRPSLRSTKPYVPATPLGQDSGRVIKLDMNESPYGPSPKAREALASFADTHRYPDFAQQELREALSQYVEMPAEQIVCGAGLDDVLNTLCHTVIDPGDEVIISEPTFGVYRLLVSLYDGVTVNVPLTEGFSLDPDRILEAISPRTKFIVICTPNNPTGNQLDTEAIERIAAEAPCLVAIDEAYAEFAGTSHIELMHRYPNVAIFRTMSKFAGLAGMRVGYGIMPESLIGPIQPVIPAFHNVSLASRVAAIASLADLPYLQGVVQQIVADRDHLAAELAKIPGVHPLSSATNFLLVRLPITDAAGVVEELARRGIYVRHFARPDLGLVDCLRVTVGTSKENAIFLEELKSILDSGAFS